MSRAHSRSLSQNDQNHSNAIYSAYRDAYLQSNSDHRLSLPTTTSRAAFADTNATLRDIIAGGGAGSVSASTSFLSDRGEGRGRGSADIVADYALTSSRRREAVDANTREMLQKHSAALDLWLGMGLSSSPLSPKQQHDAREQDADTMKNRRRSQSLPRYVEADYYAGGSNSRGNESHQSPSRSVLGGRGGSSEGRGASRDTSVVGRSRSNPREERRGGGGGGGEDHRSAAGFERHHSVDSRRRRSISPPDWLKRVESQHDDVVVNVNAIGHNQEPDSYMPADGLVDDRGQWASSPPPASSQPPTAHWARKGSPNSQRPLPRGFGASAPPGGGGRPPLHSSPRRVGNGIEVSEEGSGESYGLYTAPYAVETKRRVTTLSSTEPIHTASPPNANHLLEHGFGVESATTPHLYPSSPATAPFHVSNTAAIDAYRGGGRKGNVGVAVRAPSPLSVRQLWQETVDGEAIQHSVPYDLPPTSRQQHMVGPSGGGGGAVSVTVSESSGNATPLHQPMMPMPQGTPNAGHHHNHYAHHHELQPMPYRHHLNPNADSYGSNGRADYQSPPTHGRRGGASLADELRAVSTMLDNPSYNGHHHDDRMPNHSVPQYVDRFGEADYHHNHHHHNHHHHANGPAVPRPQGDAVDGDNASKAEAMAAFGASFEGITGATVVDDRDDAAAPIAMVRGRGRGGEGAAIDQQHDQPTDAVEMLQYRHATNDHPQNAARGNAPIERSEVRAEMYHPQSQTHEGASSPRHYYDSGAPETAAHPFAVAAPMQAPLPSAPPLPPQYYVQPHEEGMVVQTARNPPPPQYYVPAEAMMARGEGLGGAELSEAIHPQFFGITGATAPPYSGDGVVQHAFDQRGGREYRQQHNPPTVAAVDEAQPLPLRIPPRRSSDSDLSPHQQQIERHHTSDHLHHVVATYPMSPSRLDGADGRGQGGQGPFSQSNATPARDGTFGQQSAHQLPSSLSPAPMPRRFGEHGQGATPAMLAPPSPSRRGHNAAQRPNHSASSPPPLPTSPQKVSSVQKPRGSALLRAAYDVGSDERDGIHNRTRSHSATSPRLGGGGGGRGDASGRRRGSPTAPNDRSVMNRSGVAARSHSLPGKGQSSSRHSTPAAVDNTSHIDGRPDRANAVSPTPTTKAFADDVNTVLSRMERRPNALASHTHDAKDSLYSPPPAANTSHEGSNVYGVYKNGSGVKYSEEGAPLNISGRRSDVSRNVSVPTNAQFSRGISVETVETQASDGVGGGASDPFKHYHLQQPAPMLFNSAAYFDLPAPTPFNSKEALMAVDAQQRREGEHPPLPAKPLPPPRTAKKVTQTTPLDLVLHTSSVKGVGKATARSDKTSLMMKRATPSPMRERGNEDRLSRAVSEEKNTTAAAAADDDAPRAAVTMSNKSTSVTPSASTLYQRYRQQYLKEQQQQKEKQNDTCVIPPAAVSAPPAAADLALLTRQIVERPTRRNIPDNDDDFVNDEHTTSDRGVHSHAQRQQSADPHYCEPLEASADYNLHLQQQQQHGDSHEHHTVMQHDDDYYRGGDGDAKPSSTERRRFKVPDTFFSPSLSTRDSHAHSLGLDDDRRSHHNEHEPSSREACVAFESKASALQKENYDDERRAATTAATAEEEEDALFAQQAAQLEVLLEEKSRLLEALKEENQTLRAQARAMLA